MSSENLWISCRESQSFRVPCRQISSRGSVKSAYFHIEGVPVEGLTSTDLGLSGVGMLREFNNYHF